MIRSATLKLKPVLSEQFHEKSVAKQPLVMSAASVLTPPFLRLRLTAGMASNESSPANRYHCPFECGKSYTRRRDCLPHLLKQQPDPDQHHRGEEKWSSDDVQHFLSPRRLPNGVKCDVERRKELRRIWNENYYKVQQKLRAARRKRLHEAPQQHTSVPSYDTEGK